MKELEKAALAYGLSDGPQMSRFLLWVGNECFLGREAPDFVHLARRAKDLVPAFLAQDKVPS